jgi:hypothetical protein
MPSPKLTPFAKSVVKQAIKNIQEKPDQFDMDHWIGSQRRAEETSATCNKSACMAGHIVLAAGIRPIKDSSAVKAKTLSRKLGLKVEPTDPDNDAVDIGTAANLILGRPDLNEFEDMHPLYFSSNWPEPFASKFQELTYDKNGEEIAQTKTILRKRAALAVKRWRYYLKTGE